MRRVTSKLFLGRFVFRLTSFHGNSRSSFPRDSHFRMSELLTTIFRCRAIFIRYVSVAGLLVCQPATVWGIRRRAFSKCTTKLLPELTCKPHVKYLLLLFHRHSYFRSLYERIIKFINKNNCVIFLLRIKKYYFYRWNISGNLYRINNKRIF